MKKNHLMAIGLYQKWLRRTNKDFCDKSFFWEIWYFCSTTTMGGHDTRSICFLFFFFQSILIFVVDNIPHSQGMTPYLGNSKIWSTQLLLFDFSIMQW